MTFFSYLKHVNEVIRQDGHEIKNGNGNKLHRNASTKINWMVITETYTDKKTI